VAASDSCVPSLYADALESRANNRRAVYAGLVRSLAAVGRPMADVVAAAISTFLVYRFASGTAVSFRQQAIVSIVVGIVAAFSHARLQESSICNLIQIRETEAILRSAVLSQLAFLCLNLLLGSHVGVVAYILSLFAMASLMRFMRGMITDRFVAFMWLVTVRNPSSSTAIQRLQIKLHPQCFARLRAGFTRWR